MNTVQMLPSLANATGVDPSNTIHQIVVRLAKHLPEYGWEITENGNLVAAHAGMGQEGRLQPDVAICHGLYPTGERGPVSSWHWAANANVVGDLRAAKAITVPSDWVADIIRRDMHVEPVVIPWAVDCAEWEPLPHEGYVLWAKTRPDGVCDPTPVGELATRAPQRHFLTTFGGNGLLNVKTVGRQPWPTMRDMIRRAGVYLSTAKETFGITTLEAMASGVPVLGFRWGGTADLVTHGVTGYLVEPGDYDGLREGLEYCLQHRTVLGDNARMVAKVYTWKRVAAQFAEVFECVTQPRQGPKVTVVIPCHNYAQYVGQAIDSVKAQVGVDYELIVVLDRCTDDSEAVVSQKGVQCITTDFGNPADARNAGIAQGSGEYVCCLDADDALGNPGFLALLSEALDRDRTLGITFTGLRFMAADGELGSVAGWPSGYDFEGQITRHNQVPTCCVFRRDAWSRAGGYRRRYCPAEDAELWLRIGVLGFKGKQVTTEPWFLYRMHAGSLSSVVREGKTPEPDWVHDKPWTTDGKRPFASDGKPPSFSWPVRNYDQPVVSIIVPCAKYHRHLLPEALDSIESQTVRNWECIVVNDSEDPLDLHGFPWVRIINTHGARNAGISRNLGLREARAALVTFLDADDVFSPYFLEKCLRAHVRSGKYIYTDWVSLTKDGTYETHETPEYDPNDVFRKTSLHSINVLMRKADAYAVGGFPEDLNAWEDVEFFMRLAATGVCGQRVPEALVLYRYSTGSLREWGETVKDVLLSELRKRFGEYIEGRRMCGCVTPSRPKSNGAVAASGVPQDDMVRVEYVGPVGQHPVVGGATKQSYGRRAGGDVFYIYRDDQQAEPNKYLPVVEYTTGVDATPVPPEPVSLETMI